MTTKVNISCPEQSHWGLTVTVQDKIYDHEKNAYRNPVEWRTGQEIKLDPGQQANEIYVHDSRRLVIEERVLDKD